ncbi:MAG: TetR/AcrR family transcriptional regulator [Planctomycetes bacterium]|nr:TetR/AcrR family transcriptional regulator [Planctomycetota bacterium]MCW8135682.1 TetR/AcrR family transcriptional regulator [Planctomycetota bacterium]
MVRQNTGRKRDAVRTKASILSAAISEFALRGPAGTRVDEVAARAGVNKSLIYQYFGSKQELYAEALNSVLSAITEKSADYSREFAEMALGGDLRAYVKRYLDNHLSMLEAIPEYPRLIAWENLEGGRTLARMPLQATYQAFLGRVKQILEPLHDKGMLSASFNLSHVAQAVMALTHYFVIQKGTLQHLFLMDPMARDTRESWLNFCTDMFLSAFKGALKAAPGETQA